jgi:Tol biopolymer transport system component
MAHADQNLSRISHECGWSKRSRHLAGGFAGPCLSTWSPDGKRLAYGGLIGHAIDVFICNADGSHHQQLTHLGGDKSMTVWSGAVSGLSFNTPSKEHKWVRSTS